MLVTRLEIPDVLLIEPKVFRDHRGFFLETYQYDRYRQNGIDTSFIQDNHSRSSKDTLRGLHYQTRTPQAKLVWALRGEILDIAVDVRPHSPTFGRWVSAKLNEDNKHQLFVPKGFAHGFVVLSEVAEVMYKCDAPYDPKGEGGVIWNDPTLKIDWGTTTPILSEKDQALPTLDKAEKPKI